MEHNPLDKETTQAIIDRLETTLRNAKRIQHDPGIKQFIESLTNQLNALYKYKDFIEHHYVVKTKCPLTKL